MRLEISIDHRFKEPKHQESERQMRIRVLLLSALLLFASGCDRPRPIASDGETYTHKLIRVRQVSDDGSVLFDKTLDAYHAVIDSTSVRLGDGTLIQGGKITVSPADGPDPK